jgi:hypothetical protein
VLGAGSVRRKAGVMIDIYRSSLVSFVPGIADRNSSLIKQAAFSEIRSTGFTSQLQQIEKHNYAVFHY